MTRQNPRSWALGLAGILAVCLPGCRKSGVQECFDLNEKLRYGEAARRCGEVYAAEGDANAGATAAYAHYQLGHEDEVLAWADRMEKDGRERSGVWGLAAIVHQQRGDIDAANRDYTRDLELLRAEGDDHQAMADILHQLSYNAWRQSRYREAFLFASEAVEKAGKAGDRDLEIRSAELLYPILEAVGDLEGAHQAIEARRGPF